MLFEWQACCHATLIKMLLGVVKGRRVVRGSGWGQRGKALGQVIARVGGLGLEARGWGSLGLHGLGQRGGL